MSLRKRLILVFGLGSLVLFSIIFVFIFDKIEEVMTTQLSKQFVVDEKQKIKVLENKLLSLSNDFTQMSTLPMFKSMRFNTLTLNEAGVKKDIRQLELYFFNMIKNRDELIDITYVNQNAKEVFHVNKEKIYNKLQDISLSKDITKKLNLQKSDIFKSMHYKDGTLSHIVYSVPVYVTTLKKQGFIAFSIDAKYFKNMVFGAVTFKSEVICIFDENKNLILSNKKQEECKLKEDVWSLTQTVNTKPFNWKFLVSVKPEEFFKEMKDLQNVILLIVIPIILIGIFLLIGFINKILYVIEKLDKAAVKIGKGEVILDIGINRNDELGSLAKSLQKSSQMIVSKTELEAVNNDLEAYSYTLAHDLRAPLRSISSFTQILEMDCAEKLNDEEKGILERIIKASKRMASLIDDILELSRMAKCEIENVKIDLSALSLSIVTQLQENNSHLNEINIQENMNITGDTKLFRLILENLLGNAWKYSFKREIIKIDFTSYEEKNQTIYKISDNGIGFDMEYVNKLFKPFQRLHKSDEFEGTGIGLASVKRMLERHDAKVWIQSEENKGTSVFFAIDNK